MNLILSVILVATKLQWDGMFSRRKGLESQMAVSNNDCDHELQTACRNELIG